MPWLTGAGTGTRIARVVMEEEYSVMGAGARAGRRGRAGAGGRGGAPYRRAARRVPARAGRTAAERRSKRPARRGSTRVKGGGGGRLGGYARIPPRGEGSGETGGRWSPARTDRPTRGDADEEGGVGHGGAGAGESRHQEAAGGREREKRRPGDSSPAPLRLRSDLREASLAGEVGGDLRQAPEPRQHAPPFPDAPASRLGTSARRRAEASESCTVPPDRQVS